jgi:hypothetical protein
VERDQIVDKDDAPALREWADSMKPQHDIPIRYGQRIVLCRPAKWRTFGRSYRRVRPAISLHGRRAPQRPATLGCKLAQSFEEQLGDPAHARIAEPPAVDDDTEFAHETRPIARANAGTTLKWTME